MFECRELLINNTQEKWDKRRIMYKKTRLGLTWMSNVVAVDAHLGQEQDENKNIDSGPYQLLNKDAIDP